LSPPAGARKGLPYNADAVRLRTTREDVHKKAVICSGPRTQAPGRVSGRAVRLNLKPPKAGRRHDGRFNLSEPDVAQANRLGCEVRDFDLVILLVPAELGSQHELTFTPAFVVDIEDDERDVVVERSR